MRAHNGTYTGVFEDGGSAGGGTKASLELAHTIHTLAQLSAVGDIALVPQVVLAGRSNVGKSSLINCLAGRKGLARVSASPGKTRSINLYRATEGFLMLADLPGYGYARYAMSERQVWARLIEAYFAIATIRTVALLVDCRLPPQPMDLEMQSFVHGSGKDFIIVLTKTDKCSRNESASRAREWQALSGGRPVIPFSSRTGVGREEIWREMLDNQNTNSHTTPDRSL